MPERRAEPLYKTAIRRAHMEDEEAWPRSAIVGVMEVVRIWEPYDDPKRVTAMDCYLGGGEDDNDYKRWQIGRRWALPTPISCNGALKLWPLPRKAYEPIRRLRLPKEPYRDLRG